MTSEQILACDVGGTRLRVALVGAGGELIAKETIATPPSDPGALLRLMRSVMDKATDDVGLKGAMAHWTDTQGISNWHS